MQGPQGVLNVVTIPPGAGLGQRIVIDGFRGAVFEYDVNNNLVGSWASVAGTDPYDHSYPQGLSITGQGIFSGSIIAGSISNTPIGGSTITNSDFQGGTMENTVYTLDAVGGGIFVYASTVTTVTFTTVGSNNWTAPAGVTLVTAETIGGGGFGSNTGGTGAGSGGGGGGAGYAKTSLAVTPGTVYHPIVGAGANNAGSPGGDSSFAGDSATVTGHGGKSSPNNKNGGDGGTGVGTVNFTGGNGGGGSAFANNGGGGGGGAAGSGGAGSSGAGHNGGTGGAGGAGGPGLHSGGRGGNGGNNNGAGAAGAAPGAGGGGSGSNADAGGVGANGQVWLTYQTGKSLIGSWSPISQLDPTLGTVTVPKGFMLDGVNGPAVAIDPVALNIAETWHAMSLASGWSNVAGQVAAAYRMLPDGNVQTQGSISHAAFTTTQTILGTAVPTVYRPINRQWVSGNNPGDTSLDVTTNGLFGADIGNLASATTCRWNGTYSLNH